MSGTNAADVERRLHRWNPAARLDERLGGGYRNEIRAVRLGAQRLAARFGRRDDASVTWEIALLDRLRGLGFRVPVVVPSSDGMPLMNGLVVFSWIEGDPPASDEDWARVVETLRRLHAVTAGWSQRPGFRSTRELLVESAGGDVRLDLMPPDARDDVRAAWRAIVDEPTSVVHGDTGSQNLRLAGDDVGLIDWDEARVDASILDLAAIPRDLEPLLGAERLARARRSADAWEAANGWVVEPAYARRRLARLRSATSIEGSDAAAP